MSLTFRLSSLIALITIFNLCIYAQGEAAPSAEKQNEERIRKILAVTDIENEAKRLDFAAPRVLARYRLALWLWKDGKDITERAEDIAVSAFDDLVQNKANMSHYTFNSLSGRMLTLLSKNAPNTALELRNKYKNELAAGVGIAEMLGTPENDKLAVDQAIRSLMETNSVTSITLLLHELTARQSPELPRLLNAILLLEESTPNSIRTHDFLFIQQYFTPPGATLNIEGRFYAIIIRRAAAAMQTMSHERGIFGDLLRRILPALQERFPDMWQEAAAMSSALSSGANQADRERQEARDRINNSSDKLSATITEAERTNDNGFKYQLYRNAAQIALDRNLFDRATDLIVTSSEVDMSEVLLPKEVLSGTFNQFLELVSRKAITAENDRLALYAANKMTDLVRKSDMYAQAVDFYIKKQNFDSARRTYIDALKIADQIEDRTMSLIFYMNVMSNANKIDPSYVNELSRKAALVINRLPSLNVEDKPGTENYLNHVQEIMAMNWNVLTGLNRLVKENPAAAADFANRIENKEIGVLARAEVKLNAVDRITTTEITQ